MLFVNSSMNIIISLVDNMEFIALLLIFYFLIGACVCLLICVNPNDQGVLGTLNRFVFRKLPHLFSNGVRRIFGEGVLNCLGGVKHYIMQTNHPLVQIFYLLISPVGFALYQYYGIFKHMPNNKIPGIHVAIANFLAFVCFWVYYKACATSPGEITKQNVQSYIKKYKQYYDGQIYKVNNKCKTCNFDKPARSKHCSICKMCVAKHDHHCIWIRQCVGEKNYKYFVSFLFLHAVWCIYLSVIGAISLIEYLNRINFFSMRFNIEGRAVPANGLLALQYLFMSETIFFFLIVMCAIMGFTLLLFVLYHLYLISQGQTTNQRVKKNDDIDYYEKELKACKKMQTKFTGNIKEIDWKGQKVTRQDLQTYQSLCHQKIAVLKRVYDKKGFFGKLQDVFNL